MLDHRERSAPIEGQFLTAVPPAGGFARLARQISSWTSRTIISVAILVAGLAFGRQVLQWWAADTRGSAKAPPAIAATEGLGDPARLHFLAFGDQTWSLSRQGATGPRERILPMLRARCREAVRAASLPDEPPSPAELELLKSLADQTPAEGEPGGWQLYERSEPLPMVVGARPAGGGPSPPGGSASPGGSAIAPPAPRVVIWGLAIPAGRQQWTLWTFHPSSSSPGFHAARPEVPLPPGSRRLLSVRVAGGGGVVSFHGAGDAESWKAFFEEWSKRNDWRTVGTWRQNGSMWHLRWVRAGSEPAERLDLHFGPDDRGQLTGLLMFASELAASESENP